MAGWGKAIIQSGRNSTHAFRRKNGLVRPSPGAAGVFMITRSSAARRFSAAKPPTAHGRLLLPKEAPFVTSTAPPPQQHDDGGVDSGVLLYAQESFREAMTKERRPFQLLGLDTVTTAGSMCGHAGLGVLALCYVETDALTLREIVICGSTLNLFFSFYRSPPLWISIKWNALFLAINAALIALMWKEDKDAEEHGKDPEQAKIYHDVFAPVELTPVEFMQLMALAQRRVVLQGNDINQEGRPHEEMFLIVEGSADVRSEGEAVCRLEPGGFVGSMAFNRLIQESPLSSHAAAVPAPAGEVDDGDPPESVFLDNFIIGDGEYKYGGKGVFEVIKEALYHVLRGDSVVGKVAMSLVPDVVEGRKDLDKMERSRNTVTATSDVVVYVWDQHALRAFIKRRPLIGAGLQKAISEDFVNKVDQSRGHQARYRLLLEEALEGGEINIQEKRKLQRYRDIHNVSMEHHSRFLKGRGWTEEEFEAGFQQGVTTGQGMMHFVKYEALMQRELANGEVKPESKLFLLNFRKQAGIDAQQHILALEKQGWTADDYEVGVKGMPADFDRDFSAFKDGRADNKTIDADTIRLLRKIGSRAQQKGGRHEGGGGEEEGQSATKEKLPPVDPQSSATLQSHEVPRKCSA